MTSHNYGRFLTEAMDSVLSQTYTNFEFVVIDDGSTDDSPAILADYVSRYPGRIQAIHHDEAWGVSRSYNQALDMATGAIVAGISADDKWAPTALESSVRFFQANPGVDVLATDFDIIGPDGTVHTGPARLELCPQFEGYWNADFDDLYPRLLRGNFITDVAVVISLARLTTADLQYDERCPLVSDWDLLLRLAESRRWQYSPERTVFYRWHGQNMSSPQTAIDRRGDVLAQQLYVLAKQLVAARSPELRAVILEQLSRYWSDYTYMLVDAGVPNVSVMPAGAAANEMKHLRQKAEHLEQERTKQRARAEALQKDRDGQQERADLEHARAEALEQRVRRLEAANAEAQGRGSRLGAAVRRRLRPETFDHRGMFDQDWYVATYPDVKSSGVDPFEHYVRFGAAEGRDPSPDFDTDFYVAENPDVAAAGINPLEHYVRQGKQEGRLPRPPQT